MDLANGFLARDFFDLAKAEYEKYLEWFPNGALVEEAQFRIADCWRGLGKIDAARNQYEAVRKAFPQGGYFARASFRLGEMDWNAGQYAESLRQFNDAVEHAESLPTRLAAQFYQARTLIQLKRTEQALPMLQDLALTEAQNPYRAFALLELARLTEASGQEEEAAIFYTRVLDTDCAPVLLAEAGIKGGLLQMKARRWKSAIPLFEKVRKLNVSPEWTESANYHLARAYYQTDQYETLVHLLSNPENAFPEAAKAEMDLLHAHALRLLRKYPEAVRLYESFLKKHPTHASRENAAYERLICLYAVGAKSWGAEAAEYLKTFPRAEGTPRILYLQASRAFQEKNFAAAASLYATIPMGKLEPSLAPEIMYRRGISLAETGRSSEAIQAFAEFLKKFPDHAFAANALFQKGVSEQRDRKWDSALASFRELASRFPEAPEREPCLYRIALLLGELKQPAAMREAFQQLSREFPKSTFRNDADYWVGSSYFEEKKYGEALPYLERARQNKLREYGAQATSRIILAKYFLKQRSALLKEVNALSAETPVAPEIHHWLAQESLKERDFSSAEQQFQKLIAHPTAQEWRQSARWGLASSLALQSKWKQAIAVWESYLKDYTKPAEIVAAKLELVRAYIAVQDFTRAQTHAEDILKLQPEGKDSAEARFLLGEIMTGQKKHAEAAKFYLSVAVLYDDPELTPQSLSRAIQAFELAGETNQVIRLRKELLSKYPNYK